MWKEHKGNFWVMEMYLDCVDGYIDMSIYHNSLYYTYIMYAIFLVNYASKKLIF